MEEKGQAWLATRNSSTSLAKTGVGDMADDEFSLYASANSGPRSPEWPNTPSFARSRVQSRYASRIPSRLGSRMQSRAGSGANLRDDGLRALTKGGHNAAQDEIGDVEGIVGPDFVDPEVFEDEEMIEEDEIDEGEMKRIIMGRAKGWVDWAVGWMDLRNEEEEGEGSGDDLEDEKQTDSTHLGNIDRRRQREQKSPSYDDSTGCSGEAVMCDPPPRDEAAGVLADTRWLLNVVGKVIV